MLEGTINFEPVLVFVSSEDCSVHIYFHQAAKVPCNRNITQ